MDLSIIIISAILVLIIAVPLFFVMRTHKLDTRKIDTLFAQHSQNNQYKFTLVETHHRKTLGFDAQNQGLLFIDFNFNEPYVLFRDLRNCNRCTVDTVFDSRQTNKPQKVTLAFQSTSEKQAIEPLLFYDESKPHIVPVYGNEELQLAEQWRQIIQSYLK
ncbi:hypothetical protein [Flavobacterium sedimenticola]|uniref:DUF2726 domain-containing protein n=1 Tax=Flavobacterium sedimenticola TaxID=3043286 RepID=A0ABT6XQ44_9FLAO|nr:hypothetical protein [Flavobacterium sedimenticola]MDI9257213.1 hypothetical protein [Flavobacterium sedimenticola]